MRKAIRLSLVGSTLAALIGGSGLMMPVSPANAVVYCAAGVYHAGCVRRPAARAAVVAPVHRAAVVAPRCRVVNGIRRCY
jgi:hypothetical protein